MAFLFISALKIRLLLFKYCSQLHTKLRHTECKHEGPSQNSFFSAFARSALSCDTRVPLNPFRALSLFFFFSNYVIVKGFKFDKL